MNKNLNKNLKKSAYSLFARSEYDNAQEVRDLRCAFLCALSIRARSFFLSLVLALTVLAATGMAGTNVYAETGTVYVATYDQLRVALEDTQGVKEIVVDPQAAADTGDVIYSVENDENNAAFYIGFDGPLTVSHDIKITTADGADVCFARSDSFRRDQGNPALFSIDRTGTLNLEGLITMTGEEVTTTFNEGDDENSPEFIFSVKSKDGTGEDNEAWNRGQVLKGGYYIQNNGGEYNLGDDVVLKDFHTTDDVEGVEPIYEKETFSLFGGKKSDEETTTEEKSDDAVAAPAPKRMMKSAGAPALRNGDATGDQTASDQAKDLGNGNWEVSSWRQMKNLFASSNTIKKVTITQDIVATPIEGETDPVDNPVQNGKKYKSILLGGRKQVVIQGPSGKDVHIYRDADDGNFPLFVVQNDNNELTLGDNLILSGRTAKCAKSLSDFTSDNLPGNAGPIEHKDNGYSKAVLSASGGSLNRKSNTANYLVLKSEGLEIESDDGHVKTTIGGTDYWAKGGTSPTFYGGNKTDATLQIHDSQGKLATSFVDGGTYYLYDNQNDVYLIRDQYIDSVYNITKQDTKDIRSALAFTASGVAGSGGSGTYWTVPEDSTGKKYYLPDDQDKLDAAMAAYNAANPVSGWIINDKNCYTESEAITELTTYNSNNGLPTQGCGGAIDKTWTSDDFTGGDSIDDAKGFFVLVRDKGTLHINGAVLEDLKTDATVTHTAPIAVKNGATFDMSKGAIKNNTVGYGANEADSVKTAQWLKNNINNNNMTNTAGAVIFTGKGTTGSFTGTAAINRNRADAGALIVSDEASVDMNMNKTTKDDPKTGIFKNVGWHHAGAVLVDNGGSFTLTNGSINNNVAWLKGGAIWATEYGTKNLVEWKNYPNSMKDGISKQSKGGGHFIMNGGELHGNFAFVRAGAIEIESNGVELTNGSITNNMCKSLGGAIYIEGDSPLYTYTLNIKNGHIHHNTAVDSAPDDDLDQKLVEGVLTPCDNSEKYLNNQRHSDGDWSNWGMKQSGDGGGVWLCSMGGTSVFTSNDKTGADKAQVIINNNTAQEGSDNSSADNGWGHDFYISRRYGSALVQNLLGVWKDDDGEGIPNFDENGRIIKGPKGMKNHSTDLALSGSGIVISGNRSRNGGGIAANGTIVLGEASNVYRYESELNITKDWDDSLTQDEVTIKLYYQHDANKNGKIDDDEIFPLINDAKLDGTTSNETQYFEVKFGGNNTAEKPTGNEVIYRTDKNSAKAFIPATVIHKNENGEPVLDENGKPVVVHLYKIKNKQGDAYILDHLAVSDRVTEHVDTTDKAHLEALFTYLGTKGNEDVPIDIDWNIVIKEEPANKYIFRQEDLDQPTATAIVTKKVELINPDDETSIKEGSFSVNLNTVTFGQTLSNSPKSTKFEIEKVDNNNNVINKRAEFKLFEAKPAEANPSHWMIADVNKGSTFEVDKDTGILELTNLKHEHTYLLFETKAPEGFKRAIKPWLVKVDADGKVTVLRERLNRGHVVSGREVNTFSVNYNYMDDPNLSRYEWPGDWYNPEWGGAQVEKLMNEPDTPHEIYKIDGRTMPTSAENLDANSITFLNGAEFKVFEASRSDKAGGGYIYTITDTTLGENDSELTLVSEKVGQQDGVIKLPVSMNANEYKPERFYLFVETTAPNGYVKANNAFALAMTKTGTTQTAAGTIVSGGTTVHAVNSTVNLESIEKGSTIECTDFDVMTVQAIPNYPEIKIDKVDSTNIATPVNGAQFKIYSTTLANNVYSKNVELGTMTSANGKILLPYSISAGSVETAKNAQNGNDFYWLQETQPAPGYKKAERPWVVEVKNGVLQAVRYVDEEYVEGGGIGKHSNGNWNWSTQSDKKLRNEPLKFKKVSSSDSTKTLRNVKFQLYSIENAGWGKPSNRPNGQKCDAWWDENYWSGWTELNFKKGDAIGQPVFTDIKGEFSLPINEAGWYFIFEESVGNGYKDNTMRPWILLVKENGDYQIRRHNGSTVDKNKDLSGPIYYTAKNFVKTGDGKSLMLENEPIEVELIKYDHDDETKKLDGAEFWLLKLINNDTVNEQGIVNPLENAQQPLVYDETFGNNNNESDDNDNDADDTIDIVGGDDSGDTGGNTGDDSNVDESILTSLTTDKLADGQKIIIADTKNGDRRLFVAPTTNGGLVKANAGKTKNNYTTSDTDTVWYLDEYKYGNQTYYAIKSNSGKYLYARIYDNNLNSALYASTKFYTYGTGNDNYYYQKEACTSLFKINNLSGGENGMDIRAVWRVWENYKIVTKEQKICVQTQNGYGYMAGKSVNSTTRTIELCVEKDNAGQDVGDDTPGSDTPGTGTGTQEESYTHGMAMTEVLNTEGKGTGVYKATGLLDGYYQIVETKAPNGYEAIPDTKRTRLIFRVHEGQIECVEGVDPRFAQVKNTLQLKLANDKLTEREAEKRWPNGAPSNIAKIEFKLYADKGGTHTLVDTKEVSKTNDSATNWKTKFENLPKYYYDSNGAHNEIRYFVVEGKAYNAKGEEVDKSDYTPISGNDNDTLFIANHKISGGKVILTVDKEWVLANGDPDSLKKDLTIEVYNDYEVANVRGSDPVATETLNADNNWTVVIGTKVGLPLHGKDDPNRKVKYWIKESGAEGFTQVSAEEFPLVDGEYILAKKGVRSTQKTDSTQEYRAYTVKNPHIGYSGTAHWEHFIKRADGTKEQVFCLNHWKTEPEHSDTADPADGFGTKYTRRQITASELRTIMSGTTPRLGRYNPTNNDLYYRILAALYYGSGGDAANLLSDSAINKDTSLLAHMTQFAIYEYTDFYGYEYDSNYGYYRNYEKKGVLQEDYYYSYSDRRYEVSGPYGRIALDEDHRVLPALKKQYVTLMKLVAGCSKKTIDDLGLTFYIYEPEDDSYQYLVGVDSAVVNMYAHLKNERRTDEIVIYKHSSKETATEKVALNGVVFELFEKSANGTDLLGNGEKVIKKGEFTTTGEGADKGKVKISGLLTGRTYYLREKTPAPGYIKLDGVITFTISEDNDAQDTAIWNSNTSDTELKLKVGANIETPPILRVSNEPIYKLPHSGGMGTYWFMIFGMGMMTFAVTTFFTRKFGKKKL